MYGARILVLIPHPDDEVVGAAFAIRAARGQRATVVGLDLTHGRSPRDTAWPWARGSRFDALVAVRRDEAKRAAAALGILRIADTGIAARQLRFHLAATRLRVLDAIEAHDIDTVWVPAFEGAHQDHDCANAVAASVARGGGGNLTAWEFAEYNNAGGAQRNAFPKENGTERWVDATDAVAMRWKTDLLAIYGSERGNLARIGAGGAAERECFRPLPPYDYRVRPHAGRLYYERYRWVPFRHPRLDRVSALDVAKSITNFLREAEAA